MSNRFGYIGVPKTQTQSANSGIFSLSDVNALIQDDKWSGNAVTVDYLVIAGGGNGGGQFGAGGGAGGYRTSFGSGNISGANSAVESSILVTKGTDLTVTVGGGTSNSVFSTIECIRGGGGGGNGGGGGSGGSGGGGGQQGGAGGAGTAGQGKAGKSGGGNTDGGGAGGASQTPTGRQGGAGLASEITGSSVTRAGGGGSHQNGGGGTGGGGNSNGQAGTANTGGGGGGNNGAGASGVVILRYPASATITVGSGLTSSTATDGADKVTTFTAGTDNISFS